MVVRVHGRLSVALAALLWIVGSASSLRAEEEAGKKPPDLPAWARVGRQVKPSVVRIQWRPRTDPESSVERCAVAIDGSGWLLMAGPPPAPGGTMAATLADGRSMRAEIWAGDSRSALTLLRVPVSGLRPLPLRSAVAPDDAHLPRRIDPGTDFLMVTPEGSVARGSLRANHRVRQLIVPTGVLPTTITCLDEAALTVVPNDLGAPWVDEHGRLVGLLVGADVGVVSSKVAPAEGTTLRPQVVAAYAVPCDVIRVVWPLLRDRRVVERSAIGVRSRPLDEALTHHLCPDCGGWVVTALQPRGPAEQAGVELFDIVRRIGGHPLAPGAHIADALLPYRPGQKTVLSILRRGKPLELELTLAPAR